MVTVNKAAEETSMSAQEEPANLGKVLSFLREWDRGDRTARSRMLSTFVTRDTGKTFYELELEFAQVASLFLARLTTWMRLTYISGTDLRLQLKAIGIFLSPLCHDQYLTEFLEDGGILTLLDILGGSRSKDLDKAEVLSLLATVSNSGRKYKEIICESNGVKIIADCLAMSNTYETQEAAWILLKSLSQGNPKYQDQIYKTLITLMSCTSPKAQQLVLHALHAVQLQLKTAHPCIVEPLLNLLKSLHLDVQEEAMKLILDLKRYDVRGLLLTGLVALLRLNKGHEITEEADELKMTGSLSVFVQQAAAAKAIRLLTEKDQEVSHELVCLGVIQPLLCAMGNQEHADAQIQASLALEHFVRVFPVLEEHVQKVMGTTLFRTFMNKADTLYMNMNGTQAQVLLANQVNTSEVLKDSKSDC